MQESRLTLTLVIGAFNCVEIQVMGDFTMSFIDRNSINSILKLAIILGKNKQKSGSTQDSHSKLTQSQVLRSQTDVNLLIKIFACSKKEITSEQKTTW